METYHLNDLILWNFLQHKRGAMHKRTQYYFGEASQYTEPLAVHLPDVVFTQISNAGLHVQHSKKSPFDCTSGRMHLRFRKILD